MRLLRRIAPRGSCSLAPCCAYCALLHLLRDVASRGAHCGLMRPAASVAACRPVAARCGLLPVAARCGLLSRCGGCAHCGYCGPLWPALRRRRRRCRRSIAVCRRCCTPLRLLRYTAAGVAQAAAALPALCCSLLSLLHPPRCAYCGVWRPALRRRRRRCWHSPRRPSPTPSASARSCAGRSRCRNKLQ